ncbi:Uncharacterised protein [Mycobacteroides abscessus subsp. abscessus]|nr:Uncharacterised protein [Mycobacteroides abscessus subsp. abscessus]SKW29304.1 Uncharacterised protein [Mycobacteroides abscessus subsp. abscessus]
MRLLMSSMGTITNGVWSGGLGVSVGNSSRASSRLTPR